MKKPLEFISLFSGGGGLDIGFETAGWVCRYATDIDGHSVETLKSNQGRRVKGIPMLADAVIENYDVRDLKGHEILRKIGREKGQVPLLVGGPPCQSWSSAGHQLGFDDPRGQLFRDYVRIAVETGVRWIVFENVRGLLTARGPDGRPGSALQHIRQTLLEAGFQTVVELLNAADYGVPQRRVRLCLIGFKDGERPAFPSITHSRDSGSLASETRPWVPMATCLDALAKPSADELIVPNVGLAAQLAGLRPGTGVKSPGKAETTRPGGHWGYKQGAFVADTKLPARTVTAGAQQDWIQDTLVGLRRLHPRECAALQTFPANWKFAGNRIDQYRQIGNAVPVELAHAVAVVLHLHIEHQGEPASVETKNPTLAPLPSHLRSAIDYTISDQRKNGESRRQAPIKKRMRVAVEMAE